MINFWLTPNNRKVIRLTQLGSLGTLVMSASSNTPTITVGNSHFFTGQKKPLKHPSMPSRPAETPETFFSMQTPAETPATTHKHANSFSDLSHEAHESAEEIYLATICPSMSRNILLLTTEVLAHTN